jgi:hypothetical protein
MTQCGDLVWLGQYRCLTVIHCESFQQVARFTVNIVYSLIPCRDKIWAACNDNKIRIWDAKVCNCFAIHPSTFWIDQILESLSIRI